MYTWTQFGWLFGICIREHLKMMVFKFVINECFISCNTWLTTHFNCVNHPIWGQNSMCQVCVSKYHFSFVFSFLRVIRSISLYQSGTLIPGWRPHQFMFLIALRLVKLWIPSLRYFFKIMFINALKENFKYIGSDFVIFFLFGLWNFVAGLVIDKLHEWSASNSSGSPRDCIMLAACEAHETLPQSVEFPADVFTACLTTPIKMALRWWMFSPINSCLVYHLLSILYHKLSGSFNVSSFFGGKVMLHERFLTISNCFCLVAILWWLVVYIVIVYGIFSHVVCSFRVFLLYRHFILF